MAKSFWMSGQNGNFSNDKNDTFDPDKNNIGIRLQQGVPLLDRDWNEMEDIRRHQEKSLRKYYIGNGTCDNGFIISALDTPGNDFKIQAGRCLVEGFEIINNPSVNDYILYSAQENAAALTGAGGSDRIDTVYIDMWIEEITAEEDESLQNSQDIEIETSVRHRINWSVKVDEGSSGYTKENFHFYYDIAKINRLANTNIINNENIELLIRTKMSLKYVNDAIYVDDNNNVGIGTKIPAEKLDVNGRIKGNHLKVGGESYLEDTLIVEGDIISNRNLVFNNNLIISKYYEGSNKADHIWHDDTDAGAALGSWHFVSEENPHAWGNSRLIAGNVHMMNDQITNFFAGEVFIENNLVVDKKLNVLNPSEDPNYIRGDVQIDGNVTINGNIYADNLDGGTSGGDPYSDINLKNNISPIPDSLNKIASLNGIYHNWKNSEDGKNRELGVIAQDVEKVFPELVKIGKKGYKTVNYIGLIPPLLEAVKEQKTKIDEIVYENSKLHAKINQMVSSGVGHDFAEMFESIDQKEIEAGTTVVLENDKIRNANEGEVPFGVVTKNPGIICGTYLEWPKKYLKDSFGNILVEEVTEEIMVPKMKKVNWEEQKFIVKKVTEEVEKTEVVKKDNKYCKVVKKVKVKKDVAEFLFEEEDLYDSTGENIIGKHKIPIMEKKEINVQELDENQKPVFIKSKKVNKRKRPKLNPLYDETKKYIPREERPEWHCVGLIGQLHIKKGQPTSPNWTKIKDISDESELWFIK